MKKVMTYVEQGNLSEDGNYSLYQLGSHYLKFFCAENFDQRKWLPGFQEFEVAHKQNKMVNFQIRLCEERFMSDGIEKTLLSNVVELFGNSVFIEESNDHYYITIRYQNLASDTVMVSSKDFSVSIIYGSFDNNSLMLALPWFVRLAFSQVILSSRGVMLNAISLSVLGNGVVFLAGSHIGDGFDPSLWTNSIAGSQLVNQGSVLLEQDSGGNFQIFRTPWASKGDLAIDSSIPLKKLIILDDTDSNQLECTTEKDVFLALISRSNGLCWNKNSFNSTLDLFEDIVNHVAIGRLSLHLDRNALINCYNEFFKK